MNTFDLFKKEEIEKGRLIVGVQSKDVISEYEEKVSCVRSSVNSDCKD